MKIPRKATGMYSAQPIMVTFLAMAMFLLVCQWVDEIPKFHDDA
jgi:hypothetical protein